MSDMHNVEFVFNEAEAISTLLQPASNADFNEVNFQTSKVVIQTKELNGALSETWSSRAKPRTYARPLTVTACWPMPAPSTKALGFVRKAMRQVADKRLTVAAEQIYATWDQS